MAQTAHWVRIILRLFGLLLVLFAWHPNPASFEQLVCRYASTELGVFPCVLWSHETHEHEPSEPSFDFKFVRPASFLQGIVTKPRIAKRVAESVALQQHL